MLSYRHGFHAGNHADVLKHFVWVQLLRKRLPSTVWTGRKLPEMIAGWMRLESVHDCDHGHNPSTDHCGR